MSLCLIVGQTNAGKTLFLLRFAENCGLTHAEIKFQSPGGFLTKKNYPIPVAEEELVSSNKHFTRQLQSLTVQLRMGKGRYNVEIVDTAGLADGVHSDEAVRLAMVQTLKSLQLADFVIHIIDANKVNEQGVHKGIGAIDFQLAKYLQNLGNYLICANKIDIPNATRGVAMIKAAFPHIAVLPVSARTGKGLNEVKKYVRKAL